LATEDIVKDYKGLTNSAVALALEGELCGPFAVPLWAEKLLKNWESHGDGDGISSAQDFALLVIYRYIYIYIDR